MKVYGYVISIGYSRENFTCLSIFDLHSAYQFRFHLYMYMYVCFIYIYISILIPCANLSVTEVYLICQALKYELTFVRGKLCGYDDDPGTGARCAVCGAGQETASRDTSIYLLVARSLPSGRFDVNPRFKPDQSRPAVRPCTWVGDDPSRFPQMS